MDQPTDVFLEMLRRRLGMRWPKPDVDEAVEEIRIHLVDSTAQLAHEGRSDAEVEALRRIGSDKLLAENLMRSRSGIDKRSVWRIAWVPVVLAVTITTLPLALEHVGPEAFGQIQTWMACLSWLFVASFVYAIWRTRKLMLIPIGVAFVVSSLIVACYSLAGGPLTFGAGSQGGIDAYRAQLHESVDSATRALAGGDLPKASAGGAFEAPNWYATETRAILLPLPLSVATGEDRNLGLGPARDEAEARALWRANGAAYLRSVQAWLSDSERGRKETGFPVSLATVWGMIVRLTLWSFGLTAILMALNGVVLLISWLRRKLIERLWRPEVSA